MFGSKKKRQAIWDQVALDLGGTHHKQSRWWRADEHILATVGDVPVKLDVYVVSTGKSSHPYTRVEASFLHGPGPKMKVYKQGLLSSIGTALGMSDIPLGNEAFDARFVVRGKNPAVVRRLWTDEARVEYSDWLEDTQVQSDERSVKVWSAGRWEDPNKMKAAFAMIGELAGRDIYGVHTLQAIVDSNLGRDERGRPFAELDTGTRVVVSAEELDDRLVMIAFATDVAELEPKEIEIAEGRIAGGDALPQAAHAHAHAAGAGRLVIEKSSIRFVWPTLELDPQRLRAGADLLGAIAASSRGVYR